MSRGYGRVQWGCLLAIYHREQSGKPLPSTFDIAADIYKIKTDKRGGSISDAQHVAVKRALAGLQRQGRVIGFRTETERVMRWRGSRSTPR